MKYMLIFAIALLVPFAAHSLPEPILVFTFDNVDDTVKDLSGNGNDGILEADPTVVAGKFGDALEFQSSRVAVSASDSLGTELFAEGQFTIVMWISATRAGNSWQQIFRAGPEPNDTLFINNDGRLSWRGWVGAGWAGGMCETAPGVVETETWTHAAVVSDGANFRVYVNGELSKESAFQETRGNNQEFMIGGYAGGESYAGAVDDFAIFAEPLEEGDINSIMTAGLTDALAVKPMGKMITSWAAAKAGI